MVSQMFSLFVSALILNSSPIWSFSATSFGPSTKRNSVHDFRATTNDDDKNMNNDPVQRRSFMNTSFSTIVAGTIAAASGGGVLPSYAAVESSPIGGKAQYGDESIMSRKEHGTSEKPVQDDLLYGVSTKLADRICNYNRQFAEFGGYFESTDFIKTVSTSQSLPITFYDSVTGKPLFVAPIGRSAADFIRESEIHGWPSFRDQEVVWENVRTLRNSGETVSVTGTHLGHNLPDRTGNRYCINLVSIAGKPV